MNNFKLLEDYGTLSNKSGYVKKVIKAEWYGKPPVFEVRTFKPDGMPANKASMTPEEFKIFQEIVRDIII